MAHLGPKLLAEFPDLPLFLWRLFILIDDPRAKRLFVLPLCLAPALRILVELECTPRIAVRTVGRRLIGEESITGHSLSLAGAGFAIVVQTGGFVNDEFTGFVSLEVRGVLAWFTAARSGGRVGCCVKDQSAHNHS